MALLIKITLLLIILQIAYRKLSQIQQEAISSLLKPSIYRGNIPKFGQFQISRDNFLFKRVCGQQKLILHLRKVNYISSLISTKTYNSK
jgi:hypothetical protein